MTSQLTEDVAAELRSQVARAGLSRVELSRRLGRGLSRTPLSRRLRGELPMDTDELAEIASELGLVVRVTFEKEGAPPAAATA